MNEVRAAETSTKPYLKHQTRRSFASFELINWIKVPALIEELRQAAMIQEKSFSVLGFLDSADTSHKISDTCAVGPEANAAQPSKSFFSLVILLVPVSDLALCEVETTAIADISIVSVLILAGPLTENV